MSIVHLNKDNFKQEVLESENSVIVDFFAEWCGPCKMIAPVLEEIAKDESINAKICKLDIDIAGDIAEEYGVMSVPTLIVFKNGEETVRHTGALPKEKIVEMLSN